MPLIPPPSNDYDEPEEPISVNQISDRHYRWVQWYIDCPTWKCSECGTVMMGRVKFCTYCRHTNKKEVPRPLTYVENTFGG